MINSVEDIIRFLDKISNDENLDVYLEDEDGIYILNSTNPGLLNNANQGIIDTLSEVELSSSYYFFHENSLPNNLAINKLNKKGYEIISLSADEDVFTNAIIAPKFRILFSQ